MYALVVTIAALALLEGACRLKEIGFPSIPYNPTAGFLSSSRVFLPCADDPGQLCTDLDQRLTFSTQSLPARKPEGALRIVAMGGSSVFNLQACSDRAPLVCLDALAERLSGACSSCSTVEIVNAGANSYGSGRLAVVASEMIQYEPDLLLLYSGHNEHEDSVQIRHTPLRTVRLQWFLGNSALYRGMRDLAIVSKAGAVGRDAGPVPVLTGADDTSLEESRRRMEAYEANLALIVELFRSVGAETIIGTVPSNLVEPRVYGWDDLWWEIALGYEHGRWAESKQRMAEALAQNVRHQSSRDENAAIRRIAREYGLQLADVERAVEDAEPHGVPGETLFFDHCHLNARGNYILLETFEAEIVEWMAQQ